MLLTELGVVYIWRYGSPKKPIWPWLCRLLWVLGPANSSLEALQGLTQHLKRFILFFMSLLAAAAAARIMTVREVIRIFRRGFLKPELAGLFSSC